MLEDKGIDKITEVGGTYPDMSNRQGKIFKSGDVIDEKYVILDFVGKGAFGEVYRAHQLNLQRDVAIKAVSHQWLQSLEVDETEIDTALKRFRREAQAMARVRHPNVLQTFDHGSLTVKKGRDDYPVEYIVMDYIPGQTLRHTMSQEGFYPEQELVKEWLQDYYLPMLDGVAAIHALDIVHRDLKPENILMDGKTPKVADFGLARSSRLKPVTQSIEVKGTAHYMSPEHFFDFRKADQRADVYSLGKILFEAIAGKIGEGTIPFKTAGLPDADTPFFQKLDRLIQDSTAENKEERLSSVDQLKSALLDAIATSEKKPALTVPTKPNRLSILHQPKWIWTGIVFAVLSVAAMTIWHVIGEPGKSRPSDNAPRIIGEPLTSSEPLEKTQTRLSGQKPPAQTVLAGDGATLHFIPGGIVRLPENTGLTSNTQVSLKSFYMDETQVTNHQFIEFLNYNLSKIELERGVVRVDDEIWLMLGKVREGYEPIVFRNGKFKISKISYASLPVLRVTAYGAAAYARFYNRRLPTYSEWLFALGNNGAFQQAQPTDESTDSPAEMNMEGMHAQMHEQSRTDAETTKTPLSDLSPVIDYQPNQYGIRGLNKSIKEWGLWVPTSTSRDELKDAEYLVLPSTIIRQPWEAFETVGFRCIRELTHKGGK